MAIEPPSRTLFNEMEEEREYRADVRAALTGLIAREQSFFSTSEVVAQAFAVADAMRDERERRAKLAQTQE